MPAKVLAIFAYEPACFRQIDMGESTVKPRTHRTRLRRVLPAVGLLACLSAASHAAETWNSDDLAKFVDGATIMAAGGGGSPTVADKLLSKYFGASDTVTLNNVSDIVVGKGYTAASVGAIGSPDKLFALTDPLSLPFNAYAGLDLVFNKLTTPISYLMPIEIGAINGLYPFLLAVKLNKLNPSNSVSVLNVDGGGRSVPTLPLLIYSYFPKVYGQQAVVSSPTSVVEQSPQEPTEWALLTAPGGNQARIEATILSMLSGAESPYSGAAGYGSFYADADHISNSPPVVSQIAAAHAVGTAYSATPSGGSVASSLNSSGRVAKVIFSGNVTNITLETQGLDNGVVTITGSGSYANDELTIQYENENICAYKKTYSTSRPFVLGPDSVAYVPATGVVFDNSDLYNIFKQGSHPQVDVLAIKASSEVLNIPGILTAWGTVRAAIPKGLCDFPYTSPWNPGDLAKGS